MGHLSSCIQSEEAEELDYDAAGDFQRRLWERAEWPAFTVPLAADYRLHVVYRTIADDTAIGYLLHHPDWDQAEVLARDDGHFMGLGPSWPELMATADNMLPGASTIDPHSRLLLLLPAFGDDAVPDDAVGRLAGALRARTKTPRPSPLLSWRTKEPPVRVLDDNRARILRERLRVLLPQPHQSLRPVSRSPGPGGHRAGALTHTQISNGEGWCLERSSRDCCATEPTWITPFTGLSPRCFNKLVTMLRRDGADAVRRGRPWSLPLEDRVLLVTTYWRTNLTVRQLAPLFGVSKSAADRIIDHLGPMLALRSRKRFRKDTVLIVDGTLVPTRDHTVAERSKNYRYSTNHQVVIDADTLLGVVVGQPLAGNRNDCSAWEESGAKAAVGKTQTIAGGGYPGHRTRHAPPPTQGRRPARLETGT